MYQIFLVLVILYTHLFKLSRTGPLLNRQTVKKSLTVSTFVCPRSWQFPLGLLFSWECTSSLLCSYLLRPSFVPIYFVPPLFLFTSSLLCSYSLRPSFVPIYFVPPLFLFTSSLYVAIYFVPLLFLLTPSNLCSYLYLFYPLFLFTPSSTVFFSPFFLVVSLCPFTYWIFVCTPAIFLFQFTPYLLCSYLPCSLLLLCTVFYVRFHVQDISNCSSTVHSYTRTVHQLTRPLFRLVYNPPCYLQWVPALYRFRYAWSCVPIRPVLRRVSPGAGRTGSLLILIYFYNFI